MISISQGAHVRYDCYSCCNVIASVVVLVGQKLNTQACLNILMIVEQ